MKAKKVSIVMPVYNEKNLIRKILGRVFAADVCGLTKEIIIIDDGSTDGTTKRLKKIEKSHKLGGSDKLFSLVMIYKKKNEGKGAAMRDGFSLATGDIILTQDADLEYNPKDYSKLLPPIIEGRAVVVYGSRFMGEKANKGPGSLIGKNKLAYWSFFLGGTAVTIITNILYNAKVTDEATGYKVFTCGVINNIKIKSNRFEFCPEITAKIRKLKIDIFEVPIDYKPRTFEEGKKIKWKDGFSAVWALFKYRIIN